MSTLIGIVVSNTYCVIFFCFVFLCLVYPMLPVSLDCPCLIAHSVFSNVYLFYVVYFAKMFTVYISAMLLPNRISIVL